MQSRKGLGAGTRKDEIMENKAKILDRIRKLLAMSEDSSSPHEAAIAATRASKLMQKYNLDSSAVRLKEGVTQDDTTTQQAERGYGRIPAWYTMLLVPVAELHDCHVRYTSRYGTGPNAIEKVAEFLGVDSDPEVCGYVFDYICSQVELLSAKYKRDNPHLTRADTNDYRNGLAAGILQVIREMIREKAEAEREVSTGTELMIVKRDIVAKKFNVKYQNSTRRARANHHRQRGTQDGSNVRIRQGVGNSSANTRRLA
jgi:hypothetical protein